MVDLSYIIFMGILINFKIGPLVLKVVGGEAREVKVRDAGEMLTRRCSCTAIC